MLQREEYVDYCRRFKLAYGYLKEKSIEKRKCILQICELRRYDPERMYNTLDKAGFIYINSSDSVSINTIKQLGDDLGLLTKNNEFLLQNRYIFPVYDMLGNILALIGWYPDEKKYITTPSKFFSKEMLFYGMEQLGTTGIGKKYIVVEGIFDRLSVNSLGFNCVANMGITGSRYKEVLYSLFSRVLAIPDNDVEGRKVVKIDRWKIPQNGKYFRWHGVDIKDIDDLIKSYEASDIQELLKEVWKEKDRIVDVQLR